MHCSNDGRPWGAARIFRRAVLAAPLFLLPLAPVARAGPSGGTGGAAAAVVNGVGVSQQAVADVVDALIARAADPPDAAAEAALRKQALDSLIDFELLYQESQARHLTASDKAVAASIAQTEGRFRSPKEYRAALAAKKMTQADAERETRKMLGVNRLLDEVVWKDITIEDDAIRSFYEENREQFRHPAEIRASHILVRVGAGATAEQRTRARAKAEKLLQRLHGGEDFAAVARSESDDAASAARGGDLGYLSRGMMDPAFEAAAFKLRPGQLSGVVESLFGYEIVKVTAAREAGISPLAEVRSRIVAVLMDEARRRRQEAFVAQLRRKASIEIRPVRARNGAHEPLSGQKRP